MFTPARGFLCYYLHVRQYRIARSLAALICIALLLLCVAMGPTAAHLHLAIPALVFCFLLVLRLSLLRIPDGNSPVQLNSLLTVHTSRGPP
ncbi:MAG TPA: hypothetical protein VNH18_15805, partial [Bryobacteraceae bacterium]|nr:hypothetical protein [Bryobacteraceae bacterium]